MVYILSLYAPFSLYALVIPSQRNHHNSTDVTSSSFTSLQPSLDSCGATTKELQCIQHFQDRFFFYKTQSLADHKAIVLEAYHHHFFPKRLLYVFVSPTTLSLHHIYQMASIMQRCVAPFILLLHDVGTSFFSK